MSKGFCELQQARKQDETWEEIRNEVDVSLSEQRALEKAIDQQKNQVSVELQRHSAMSKSYKLWPNNNLGESREVQASQEQVMRLEALSRNDHNKELGTECRASLEQLQTEQARLQKQLQEAEEKLDLLLRSDIPRPLCASDLAGQKARTLKRIFVRKFSSYEHKTRKYAYD